MTNRLETNIMPESTYGPSSPPTLSAPSSPDLEAAAGQGLHSLTGRRALIFTVLAGAYLLVFFHRLSPAVIALDLMRDLSVGGAAIGLLSSAYFYPYAVMQLPAGLLSDSWGSRRTVTVFFLIAGVGSLLFGLAGGWGWALTARVLVGVGVAMVFVPTLKILTHWYAPAQFQGMTGILLAVGGSGMYAAAAPLAWLSDLWGWRISMIVIGAATLVWSGLIWLLVRDRPSQLGFADPEGLTAPAGEEIGIWEGTKLVLGTFAFWPLALWFTASAGIFFSFGGLWGGPFLMQVHGLSKAAAGGVLSMLAVGMIAGSLAISALDRRLLGRRRRVLRASSLIMLALCLWLAFWPRSLNLPLLYLWFLVFSMVGNAVGVLAFAAAKELFPVHLSGTSVGLINMFPFVGAMIMQPLVGWLLQTQGGGDGAYSEQAYSHAFLAYLGAALAAFIGASLIREERPRA